MNNLLLFFPHTLFVTIVTIIALRMGKEALIAVFCLFALVPNIFILKQIDISYFTITCCEPYIVAAFLSLNLLQHHFGKEISKKAITICFFILGSFAVLSAFQLLYTPSIHDTAHGTYVALLKPMPRIILSSFLVTFLAQRFDRRLQIFVREKWPKIPYTFGIFIPICISQAFDTVAFSYLALYGVMHNITAIILVSYVTKLVVILCMSFLVKFSSKWIRKEVAV